MISFEHRILSEYRIKRSKIDTLVRSVGSYGDPKSLEAKGASDFLDVLINEIDSFYEKYSEILSNNGISPHHRSRLPETKHWNDNIELFYEKNPYRRRRSKK